MTLKKTTIAAAAAVAAFALSTAALADRGSQRDYRHAKPAKHYVVKHQTYRPVVQHRVVHHRPVHRTVVVHRPQPVVYHSVHPNTGAAIMFGAVLGAVLGHHIAAGY